MNQDYVVYDIEIIRAVPIKNEKPIPGIEYCEGWHDHKGMGVSCIGAYDSNEDRYRVFSFPSHAGYSLDAVSEANFSEKKTGHVALAPVDWQRGNWGTVIDYCLQDVRLTDKLFRRICDLGTLIIPANKGGGQSGTFRPPFREVQGV